MLMLKAYSVRLALDAHYRQPACRRVDHFEDGLLGLPEPGVGGFRAGPDDLDRLAVPAFPFALRRRHQGDGRRLGPDAGRGVPEGEKSGGRLPEVRGRQAVEDRPPCRRPVEVVVLGYGVGHAYRQRMGQADRWRIRAWANEFNRTNRGPG